MRANPLTATGPENLPAASAARRPDPHTRWTKRRGLVKNGYLASDFPGSPGQIPDGNAYFARSQSIADEFAQSYGEGVIETRVPADVYAERYAQYERLYQGGPRVEVPIPANEVESLNEFPRIWHR